MGNKIQGEQIKIRIDELSNKSYYKSEILKTDILNLINLIGYDFKRSLDLEKILIEILTTYKEESIIKLIDNLIFFIKHNIVDIKNIVFSLEFIRIIILSIKKKHKSFREILIYSICKNKEINIKSDIFPINLIDLCFELNSNQEYEKNFIKADLSNNLFGSNLFENNDIFLSNTSFYIFSRVISILYEIFFYQKSNEVAAKNYLDYIDFFKFCAFYYFDKEKKNDIDNFIKKLFYSSFKFITNCKYIFKDQQNYNIIYYFFDKNQIDFENFICYNIYLLTWFCFDVNKFILKNSTYITNKTSNLQELYFENEFNEKIFISLSKFFFEGDKNLFKYTVEEYNRVFYNKIKENIISNINDFKEFVNYFYLNTDNFCYKFKIIVKMLIIYIFEFDQDICENLCLNKIFIQNFIENFEYTDIFDLIIFTKMTLSNNFYIMMKFLNFDVKKLKNTSKSWNLFVHEEEKNENFDLSFLGDTSVFIDKAQGFKTDTEDNVDIGENDKIYILKILCEKLMKLILFNRKSERRLDSVSYCLLLIIFNISTFLKEINNNILIEISKFLIHFNQIELTAKNLMENLMILKMFLELCLKFTYNLEYHSYIILILLKSEDTFFKIHNRFSNIFAKKIKTDSCNDSWNQYEDLKSKLDFIFSKAKEIIANEGGDIRFTYNFELIRMINKISFDKEKDRNLQLCTQNSLKKNTILNTETEKFFILNINAFDSGRPKILFN